MVVISDSKKKPICFDAHAIRVIERMANCKLIFLEPGERPPSFCRTFAVSYPACGGGDIEGGAGGPDAGGVSSGGEGVA